MVINYPSSPILYGTVIAKLQGASENNRYDRRSDCVKF
jgi:hypothetical protein